MSKTKKLLTKILIGSSDANIGFEGLCNLLGKLGFYLRIKGSHHIFTKDNIEEILNLQSLNDKAKAYQVKQVREIILKYQLAGQLEENENE
jgi:predicted RNA binding protein YcfA (HicA-like mRNA interferase family)